ncbi:MAG: RNA polymerase factor sigma-54 [Hyphomicrobium sp.]|nr:RNA polymerase factor sigma-54 [Hyphomicrobium sp.]
MALTTKLELRQGQQLVMTPQLQQAIRLLQFSNLELSQYVETELERNPLLERDDPQPERETPATEDQRDQDGSEAPDGSSGNEGEDWLDLEKRSGEAAGELDAEYDNVYPDASAADIGPDLQAGQWSQVRQRGSSFEDDDVNLESYATSDVTLREHLSEQLNLTIHDPVDRMIGHYLIDTVDETGYLNANIGELSLKLGAPIELIERVLAVLQTFEPVGVCARTLAECLAIQLKDQNRYDPQIGALLDNLQLLAQHNLVALRRVTGATNEDLADMISEIKRLNPKPGLKLGRVHMQPVVPDIIVKAASDGSWFIELNSETLPRVLVNRVYYSKVSRTAKNDRDKGYLLECLQTANWLVKSLDQRARTILKVAEEIVRQQDAFFTYGVQHLRPMNLKTVADAISMHESTVSRVTSNKYIATPRGIFELKYFFTSAIAAANGDGEAYSSESVRHRIRQMIDQEPATAILSDDMIVERLKGDGIDIARRTVAKYREAMRIPSSVQRRREKRFSSEAGRGF